MVDVPSSNCCCDNPSPNSKTLCWQNRLPNSELQLVQNCSTQWEIDRTHMAVGNLIDSPTGSLEMLSIYSTLPSPEIEISAYSYYSLLPWQHSTTALCLIQCSRKSRLWELLSSQLIGTDGYDIIEGTAEVKWYVYH